MRDANARINFRRIIKENIKFSWTEQSGFREVLIFVAFLVLYKISRFIAIGDESTAFENAYKVVEWEKMMGIYYEIPFQQFFLDKKLLTQFLNQIYIRVHVPSTVIFFLWLYHRHRHYYFHIRNLFIFTNIITVFFFIGFPCAPPRMLNELGFVDTLYEISNVDIYEGKLSYLFNQYAAMPSMHFGTALLIAIIVFALSKNQWMRWSILSYPIFVLVVIVATANHFFLDAVLGGILVLLPLPLLLYFKPSRELANNGYAKVEKKESPSFQ